MRASARSANSRSSTSSSARGSSSRARPAAVSAASASSVSSAARSAAATRVVEQALGPVAGAFEPAQRARQRPLRPGLALDLADRLADRLAEPLGVLQQRAAGAEPFLLVALGRQRLDLGEMMPQQILLGAAFGEQARRLGGALARRTPLAPGRGERVGADRVFREGVEQRAVRRRVQQAALLALALDLDEACRRVRAAARRWPARR